MHYFAKSLQGRGITGKLRKGPIGLILGQGDSTAQLPVSEYCDPVTYMHVPSPSEDSETAIHVW